MSTFRFGSSICPARVARHGPELTEEVDAKPVDDADPNALVQCPYDKNHQVRASRFPFHILKCAKNHPKLASELEMCPFNAKHLVPKHKLGHHIEHCPNKQSTTVEGDGNVKMDQKFHVPIKWTPPACEEDWENEVDDNAATFVWGLGNNSLHVNNPKPLVKDNLNAAVRAPRTLPWKSCEFWAQIRSYLLSCTLRWSGLAFWFEV